jgi:hypothetical protein
MDEVNSIMSKLEQLIRGKRVDDVALLDQSHGLFVTARQKFDTRGIEYMIFDLYAALCTCQ